MIFSDVKLVDDNPSWLLVLQAYRALELEAAEARAVEREKAKAAQEIAESEDDGNDASSDDQAKKGLAAFADDRWTPRLCEIEGVDGEELSAIYGKLIAYELLKVKLLGRDGLVYQLTNLGKRAVISPAERATDDDDFEAEAA